MQGAALLAALWWPYFDYVVLAAERRLASAQGHERTALARDSYSYLHLLYLAIGTLLVSDALYSSTKTLSQGPKG